MFLCAKPYVSGFNMPHFACRNLCFWTVKAPLLEGERIGFGDLKGLGVEIMSSATRQL
jgi:hypothetical protein